MIFFLVIKKQHKHKLNRIFIMKKIENIFAVIIATYKRADGSSYSNLKRVSQFLKNQTYQNFKIFLVGLLVLVIFSIPTINAIDQVKASNLFRNVFQNLQFFYTKTSIAVSLCLLGLLILLFTLGSARPIYSLGYFAAFFVCLIVFFLLRKYLPMIFFWSEDMSKLFL